MMNGERQRQRLSRFVEAGIGAIRAGEKIVVSGWMGKNHNDFTRQLPKDLVVFVEGGKLTEAMARKAGLVLQTKFGPHASADKARLAGYTNTKPLGVQQVKDILKDISLSFSENDKPDKADGEGKPKPERGMKEKNFSKVRPTQLGEENLKRLFNAILSRMSDGRIGVKASGKIARELFPGMNTTTHFAHLRNHNFLVGHKAEGKGSIGSYSLGPEAKKLLEFEGAPPEVPIPSVTETPSNDLGARVGKILAEEEELLQERERLSARYTEVDDRLREIQKIREAIDKLTK